MKGLIFMVLLKGNIGDIYTVQNIDLEDNIKRRLQMLGLTDGTKISVLNSKRRGTMIIKVRGTRFAIGRDIAAGISVGGVF